MIVINGTVGSGKTRRLIERASEIGAVVVCKNPDRMHLKAETYGICGVPCYNYSDYLFGKTEGEKVLIDSIEDLLLAINKDTSGFTVCDTQETIV